jgi:hypothetical protein
MNKSKSMTKVTPEIQGALKEYRRLANQDSSHASINVIVKRYGVGTRTGFNYSDFVRAIVSGNATVVETADLIVVLAACAIFAHVVLDLNGTEDLTLV